ncbi:MAG: hypothetical protein D6726_05480 [Nitrospirae bacterium]|nr:MAG: hypothetical protein D6726_05480 [Nitrospirota bacterium]
MLKKLCSDPKAVLEILEKLSEKNLFVTGTSDVEGGYYLHDLFREFLKYEAKNHLGKERYSKHLLKVGRALKELDYMEDAINIFSRTGELSEIVEILNTCALTWLHTGRIYTINRCLSILEASAYSNNPWVLYLRATITRFTEPERALKLYEKALHGFKNKRDLQGSKATLSEILNTAQYMGEDFNSVGRFIDQAEKAVQDRTEPLTVADAMLSASLGVMYLINRGVSSKSVEYFKLADRLLEQTEEMSPFRTYTKIYTAIALHSAGECRKAEEYFNEAGKIFKNCPEYPQHRFMFNLFASIHELFSGRFSESVKRINNTLAYARRWKLHHQEEHLLNRKLAGLVSQGLIEEAKETLKEIRSLKHRNSFSRAITEQYVAQMHLIEGNPLFAIKAAECSADLFSKIGASIFASVSRGLRAVALAERGNFKEARKILLENIKRGKKKENLMHVFTSLCYLAYITLKERGKEEAKDVLKEALSLGAERGFMSTHNWCPPMISTLLATAFEYGIEVDYASSLIRFHRIPPPAILVKESDWPWSLRIFTFGKFKMYKGDTLITHQEWRGSMALNLMLALLFYDTVEGIPVSTITDLLWTESDGDRAFQNLEFTLRKLRKIVGHKGNLPLIILKGGKLIINTDLCYVDSIMFQRHSDLSEISYLEGRLDDAIRHGEVAVSTYKGRFLKNHEGYWIKKKQEQLHQQYLQTVKRLLECYREKGDWEKITRLYKKAIAVETSSEYPVSYLLKREAPAGIKKETAKIFKEFTEILNDFTATSFTDKPNR